jgi:DNA-binding transcriptional MocR family regulator
MRSRYASRRATLLAALRRIPELRLRETPPAGLFVLAHMAFDEAELVARAAEAGVGLEGLGLHRFEPGGAGGLVLGYGALAEPALERAVELLSGAVSRASAAPARSGSAAAADAPA